MTNRLIASLERALSALAQEVDKGASVLVQYAAGDWAELKAALTEAKESAVAPVDPTSTPPPEPPLV